MPMKEVTVYTDGACSGNPGPGGWGVILMYGPHKKEMSGGEPATTNNRMELTAVITALEALREPCSVTLYTDSKYVVSAINEGWVYGWAKNGWKRKTGEVKNPEMWQRLMPLLKKHSVKFVWVRGHAENEYNNRCDELAVAERKKFA